MRLLILFFIMNLLSIDSTIAQTSSIHGRVSNSKDSSYVRWATVLLSQNDSVIEVTHTNVEGKYSFNYLDSGTYQVYATYLDAKPMQTTTLHLGLNERLAINKFIQFEGTIVKPIYITHNPTRRTITTGCPGPICRFPTRHYIVDIIISVHTPNLYSFDLVTITKVVNEKSGVIETTQSFENYDGMGANLLWSSDFISGGGISQGQAVDLFIE